MKKKPRNKRADYTLIEEIAADLKKTFFFVIALVLLFLVGFAVFSSFLNDF